MNIENHSILQHYIKLTEFLGRTLGPDYEIVLHSLEDKEKSIIACQQPCQRTGTGSTSGQRDSADHCG